jgi:hypothetical protein
VLLVGLVACGGDDESGDAERFCGEVAEHRDLLTRPQLGASGDVDADIEALLAEYRRIGEFAPLAVEADWDQLVEAYETAAAVDAADPESEQAALEAVFRAERSAVAVADWLRRTCAVDIGPIATIVPEAGASTTTTSTTTSTTAPSSTTG